MLTYVAAGLVVGSVIAIALLVPVWLAIASSRLSRGLHSRERDDR